MLPTLLRDYQIIHLCGKGNLSQEHSKTNGYVQFDYISDGLNDLLAASDLVISEQEQMQYVNFWRCVSPIS